MVSPPAPVEPQRPATFSVEEFCLLSNLNLPWQSLRHCTHVPGCLGEEANSHLTTTFFQPSYREQWDLCWAFSRLNNPNFLSCTSYELLSQTLPQLHCTLWHTNYLYTLRQMLAFLPLFPVEWCVSLQSVFLRFVYLELPAAAKTPCTRFRWWQPVFSGEGYDQWAIDDIIILSEKQKHIIPVVNPTLPQVMSTSRLLAAPWNRNNPVRRLVWRQFSLKILGLFKKTAVVLAAASVCGSNLGYSHRLLNFVTENVMMYLGKKSRLKFWKLKFFENHGK